MHGGAYAFLSASPRDPTTHIGRGLMERDGSTGRLFSIKYRLTMTADNEIVNPFSTQLIDALTGYYYIVHTVGFSPANIILDGDSAGAKLALALTLYVVENPNREDVKIPAPPGKLFLLSPWCDLSPICATPRSSWAEFVGIDYLHSDDSPVEGSDFSWSVRTARSRSEPLHLPCSDASLSVRLVQRFPSHVYTYEPSEATHDFLGMTWIA
ncbi:hypothetical protein NEOLEDRAFT_1135402 [Neolentinus lepideus HHB14362 ss-1]|uniref:Alpha/beta hydrolase fold-3 domain-containing protein n=1 Tax=Neolentinus lepideus HHB14362 ss-1 TaxID=1314782 RepID=A0A165RTA7_9AGAM|nr:hypothetical protein NEOLEDRAFT_1135402 [Neolentinus lepideus HHB14362 ss-1]